MQILYFTRS